MLSLPRPLQLGGQVWVPGVGFFLLTRFRIGLRRHQPHGGIVDPLLVFVLVIFDWAFPVACLRACLLLLCHEYSYFCRADGVRCGMWASTTEVSDLCKRWEKAPSPRSFLCPLKSL